MAKSTRCGGVCLAAPELWQQQRNAFVAIQFMVLIAYMIQLLRIV